MASYYRVRDPIYGFIEFNEFERAVINSRPFQRLRNIQQLALTSFLYPGATHTRFSHSLGVMHMASLMFDEILKKQTNVDLLKNEFQLQDLNTQRIRQILRLAALLHDVGHGPFSHACEEIMPFKNGESKGRYTHEEYSVEIIKTALEQIIDDKRINIDRIASDEITDLILGTGDEIGPFGSFWKGIISSQLDADRADYLLRDSHFCGVKYGIYDFQRLINILEIGRDPETEELKICVNEEGWQNAEELILARHRINPQVYFHRTRRAFDYHLQEGIKFVFKQEGKTFPLPTELDAFIDLDDFSLMELFKNHPNNEHCDAILNRNHIRCIYSKEGKIEQKDEERIGECASKLQEENIWYYIDSHGLKAYKKFDKDSIIPKEVYLINKDNSMFPLTQYSSILSHLPHFTFKRLYVKLSDKEQAQQILGGSK